MVQVALTVYVDEQEGTTLRAALNERAEQLAISLGLPFLDYEDSKGKGYDFLLRLSGHGLELVLERAAAPGPVRVDFENPTLDYRIRNRVSRQAIARAIGIKPGFHPDVLDATAGLGKDAYLLASCGCRVKLLERNFLVHALLEDGLRRAGLSRDPAILEAVSRMDLSHSSLADFRIRGLAFDVVYLDPMFPARGKSARVKKDMYVLQQYFSDSREKNDEPGMLRDALDIARRRVVVKRPARAGDLGGQIPSFRLTGKSSRFDVYLAGSQLPNSQPADKTF
ncbi:MAG: class I SAM-dependent methyltransferase [Pseudomonadales bacterium]|nr:class I SAM-dependent methyltransferase [Pseudomonadales bacterium]